MRRGLLASCLLILAAAPGFASTGGSSMQASGVAGSWSKVASPITGREEHTATLLRNGSILIAGGSDGRGKALASAELYDPATNRWTSAGSMATPRLDHTATLLRSGKVLVAGGLDAPFPSNSLASGELYDPTTNGWSPAAPMIGSRARQTATLLLDGRVLVVGGLSVALRVSGFFPSQPTDAEIYDPTANRWSATAAMGSYRVDQTATRLTNGRVLVAGGQDGLIAFDSAEIYDAGQNRWFAAAPMTTGRFGHAAAQLANGDVLVAGGTYKSIVPADSMAPLSSAEIYDPSINRWLIVTRMAEVHVEHTATLLHSGIVLVVGATGRSRPELYDPARNAWSTTGPSMDRYHHTATLLPNGKVLIVGGYALESLDSVLLYDPSAVAPLPRRPPDPRVIAALVLLLVAGIALSTPAVRQRLKRWHPWGEPEEWIT